MSGDTVYVLSLLISIYPQCLHLSLRIDMYMCVYVCVCICICVYMYMCLVCRCRLESSMDQWSDLIEKIRRLIDYLTSRENELIAARPVAGNLPAIKSQQTKHQVSKTPARCPKNILIHTPCLLSTIIYSCRSLFIA